MKLITNSKGNILEVNQRSNPRYYRVYEGLTQIRLKIEKTSLGFCSRLFFQFSI